MKSFALNVSVLLALGGAVTAQAAAGGGRAVAVPLAALGVTLQEAGAQGTTGNVDEPTPVEIMDFVAGTAPADDLVSDGQTSMPGVTIQINEQIDVQEVPADEFFEGLGETDSLPTEAAFYAASVDEEPVALADVVDELPKKILLPRDGFEEGFVALSVPQAANPVTASTPSRARTEDLSNVDDKLTIVVPPEGSARKARRSVPFGLPAGRMPQQSRQ